jgi:hypothetical protein
LCGYPAQICASEGEKFGSETSGERVLKFHDNVRVAADPMRIDVEDVAEQWRAFVKLDDCHCVAHLGGQTIATMAQRSGRSVSSVVSF